MNDKNWQTKVLLMGALIGALTGVGAAYMLVKKSEKEETPLKIGTPEGVKLGMLLLGTLRQIAQIGDGK